MANLSPDELRTIMQKLDEVCRQAQELQKQVRAQMVERAGQDRAAQSAAPLKDRRSRRRRAK